MSKNDSLPPHVQLQTIAEIGDLFDENFVNHMKFLSDDYFLDADILVVSIRALQLEFSQLMSVEGVVNFYMSHDALQKFTTKLKQRKAQIDQYLQRGGVLFVMIDNEAVYSYKQGNGSDAEQAEIDFLEAILLDSNDFSVEQMNGSNIVYADKLYTDFFNAWDVSYTFSYSKFKGYQLAKVKNTNQAISVGVPHGKGLIMLLPKLGLSADDYDDYQNRQFDARMAILTFMYQYQQSKPIIKDVALPKWCNDFLLGDERKELEKLIMLQEQLAEVQKSISKQEDLLQDYQQLKQLLSGTGKPLEAVIEQSFSEFGFELLPTAPGRDDLIIKYVERVAVIEIKGVKGSASEQNATQLMKWVSNYHHENSIEPKGILIVNSFRDVPLDNRKEAAFPHQMLNYATRMQLCLMTTYQLLGLYLDFKAGDKTLNDISQLIFDSIGPLVYEPLKITKKAE